MRSGSTVRCPGTGGRPQRSAATVRGVDATVATYWLRSEAACLSIATLTPHHAVVGQSLV
eukprot:2815288-Prymnesium_polylepis.1